jgi:hypothetical protein
VAKNEQQHFFFEFSWDFHFHPQQTHIGIAYPLLAYDEEDSGWLIIFRGQSLELTQLQSDQNTIE